MHINSLLYIFMHIIYINTAFILQSDQFLPPVLIHTQQPHIYAPAVTIKIFLNNIKKLQLSVFIIRRKI